MKTRSLINKETLRELLKVSFTKNVDIIPYHFSRAEAVKQLEENPIFIKTDTILDFNKYIGNKKEFIANTKKSLIKKLKTRDPVKIILIERLSNVIFYLTYLDAKYPDTELLIGTTPSANTFVHELEAIKEKLTQQFVYLAQGIHLINSDITEIRCLSPKSKEKVTRKFKGVKNEDK
jgi:hypothetical protein